MYSACRPRHPRSLTAPCGMTARPDEASLCKSGPDGRLWEKHPAEKSLEPTVTFGKMGSRK